MNSPEQQPLPPAAQAHLLAGQQAHGQRDFATALREYQCADKLAPESEAVLASFAALAMDLKDWQSAERTLRYLENRFPGRHRARLALTLFNLNQYRDALPLLQALVDAGNTDLSCILAYAACLERTGNEAKSIDILEQLYRAMPTVDFAFHLAAALLRVSRADLLDKRLPELLADHPGNPRLLSCLSEHAMTRGDYAQGFDLAHYRWASSLEASKAATLHSEPWDGQRFDGTLLVTAEQGIGDEILASSLFEELVAMGQSALVECDARLLPVFRRSFPALEFVDRKSDALNDRERLGPCRKIAGIDLGRFFRRSAGAFPRRTHWLKADPQRRAQLRQLLESRFPGRRYTGISWRSRHLIVGDAKSIPIAELAPLLGEPGTVFIDLQYGDTRLDLESLRKETGLAVQHLEEIDNLNDIDGLFALVDALDDVVSSSNSTVHIAAALGKPVAAMIPGTRYSLWYWGYEGAHTPWYPSITLYRGPTLKSWRELAGDVAAARRTLPTPGA